MGGGKSADYQWNVTGLKNTNATFQVNFKSQHIPNPLVPKIFNLLTGHIPVLISFNGDTPRPWDDVRVGYPVRTNNMSIKITPDNSAVIGKPFSWSLRASEHDPQIVDPNPKFDTPVMLGAEGITFEARLDGGDSDFSFVLEGVNHTLVMSMQLAYHDPAYFLTAIEKSTVGSYITLKTRSMGTTVLWTQQVKVVWRWRGGILHSGRTDNLGYSSVTFNSNSVNGPISVEMYIKGEPHSVKTIQI